eukprot:15023022-Alexandrium_andersonii.AAC.1
MSASLVGSEMCIRDSLIAAAHAGVRCAIPAGSVGRGALAVGAGPTAEVEARPAQALEVPLVAAVGDGVVGRAVGGRPEPLQ